jgi:solute carrier family 20 (sodium-dependent phosphate transporter)
VGGILGFALVWAGADAVKWADKNDSVFPPYSGVLPIVLSWFVAPVLTASASAGIFAICRQFILRRSNGVARSYYVLPLAVFITTWVNIYFVLTKVRAKENLFANLSKLLLVSCSAAQALLFSLPANAYLCCEHTVHATTVSTSYCC